MSRVLQVLDERNGQRVALKQSLSDPQTAQHARSVSLFRQEFHVLSQIAHPNVVKAFEYGVDADQPFYTMELLDGRSLHDLSPLPWQTLCSILVDLCAPLSMLHARRFVHCDVTTRNVIVTNARVTKLIDFGALTAIDQLSGTVSGTPPHMAPELVRGQSIDGRVDMFALGALAYWVLAGRHAYPARSIRELHQVWGAPPPTLRALGVEVPAALDELIMTLLSLDAEARPMQLAELVQRLSAIAPDVRAVDASALRAQLARPKLIGRAWAIEAFRELYRQASRAHGNIMCVSGAAGMGRSRVLEAFALEAAFQGALVVRVDCEAEGANLAWGAVARILATAAHQERSVLDALPPGIRDAITHASDALQAVSAALASLNPGELWQCWRALCRRQPAVILVDDLARADVTSIQQLLTLADLSKRLSILTVVSIHAGSTNLEREVATILERSRNLQLAEHSLSETLLLLRSLFGDITELDRLADWAHRAGAGVPRASVELAHFALERGLVRFAEGAFHVSAEVTHGTAALPKVIEEAIAWRLEALPPRAREATGALALVTKVGQLSAEEYQALLGSAGWSQAQVLDVLDAQNDARLVLLSGDGYEPSSEAVSRRARQLLDAASASVWHRRLARVYEQRGHAGTMLAALHYEYAGDRATAYARLMGLDSKLQGPDDPNIRLGGSALGIALHQTMLEHALQSHAPRVEALDLRRILVSIGATSDARLGAGGPVLLRELCSDVGLDFWESADAGLDEHARLLVCLTRAQERFDQAAPGERFAPLAAIGKLAESVASLSAIASSSCDAGLAAALVRQFQPLRTLAPVLAITVRMVEGTARALTHGGLDIGRWKSLVEALQSRPEGLSELIWTYMLGGMHFALGRELGALGDDACLAHADALDTQQRTRAQACSLRLLHALAHGWFHEASQYRKERTIAALSSRHDDQRLSASYVLELGLLDACGDLLELRRLTAWIEARSASLPGWSPLAGYARACCYLQCEQLAEAEREIMAQLDAAPPLVHAAWYPLRALRAEVALRSGHAELALQLAQDVSRMAADAGVDMAWDLRAERVIALARATLGDPSGALAGLAPLMAAVSSARAKTVHAAQLHETRARIALLAEDQAAFEGACAQLHQIYGRGAHPGLLARLQRLSTAGRALTGGADPATQRAAATTLVQSETIRTELDRLSRAAQLDYLLALLLRDAQAFAGHLYCASKGGFVPVASQQTAQGNDSFHAQVNAYVATLQALDDMVTHTMASDALFPIRRNSPETGDERYQVVALRAPDDRLLAVALLRAEPGRVLATCTPQLCAIVADAIVRLRLADSQGH